MKSNNTNYKEIPLDSIAAPPYNTIMEDQKTEGILKNTLLQYGQYVCIPVRVNEDGQYESILGEVLLKCLKSIGYSSVMCYDMGQIPLSRAKLAVLEINLLNFEPNDLVISQLLNDLLKDYTITDLYEKIPITPNKLDKIIQLLTYDWENATAEEKIKQKIKEVIKMEKILKPAISKNPVQLKTYKRITLDSFFNNIIIKNHD